MDVFLDNTIVDAEEAEQIIYRLVVQKRINASINMNNGRTFITSLEVDEPVEKKTEKPKVTKEPPKKAPAKKTSTTTKKKTTTKTTPKKKTSTTSKTATKSSTTKKATKDSKT